MLWIPPNVVATFEGSAGLGFHVDTDRTDLCGNVI